MVKKVTSENAGTEQPGAQTLNMGDQAPNPGGGKGGPGAANPGQHPDDAERGKGPSGGTGTEQPGAQTAGLGDPRGKEKAEKRETLADFEARRKKERAEFEAQVRQTNRINMATNIATAVLRNPAIEKFCYGSPLEPHACGGAPSVGAYLARESLRLADDYLAELDCLVNPPKPAPVTATGVVAAEAETTTARTEGGDDMFPPLD